MAREYLKKATLTAKSDATETKKIVREILDDIEAGGDEAALKYAAKFDQYDGEIILSEASIAAALLIAARFRRDPEASADTVICFRR